ncbi:DUF6221 family protein [Promicromonospora thailandica]|uniref:Uncharacterized protein n=1 Tax=Promicromonospora thailandica TaxID=765201 RepID=A0A9X2JWU3_9MICO|nr:DUF6221 family protein [Promicromonospora thailandica]MCP2265518.1 hypothetical protein [Promicromonospora thailandica]BFF17080.1 hypothetical protein GCM10025730_06010 [Promicromonospora thailandica]
MTITEFLRARLDEDEVIARMADSAASIPGAGNGAPTSAAFLAQQQRHIVRWSPARVLVDVAAKRQIVAAYDKFGKIWDQAAGSGHDDQAEVSRNLFSGLMIAVRLLAGVYSDHPDYQRDWRPET